METLLEFVRIDLGSPGLATLISNPSFAFIQVMNSISMGMNFFIIASGLSLIFGVLKVINFAHGAFYMFGAYITYSVTHTMGLNFFWGVLASAVGLVFLSAIIERSLFRFVYDKEHLMQLLLTFALVLILGDLAKIIWGTDQYSVSYPASLSGASNLGIAYYPSYRLLLCALGPIIFLALWLFIERTRWGRLTKAATQNREMLAALGINVPMIYTCVFIAGSALAGIGGALASPFNSPTPWHGHCHHRGVFCDRHYRWLRFTMGHVHWRVDLRLCVQFWIGDSTQWSGHICLLDSAGCIAHPAVGSLWAA